jgi:glutathione S-transferase
MTTPALTLYYAPGSSSMAPHIALHEIGAPFEGRPLSFDKKELKTPEFLAINPQGTVPTLLVGGRAMTEVAAILFYLARRFPEARLLPENDIEAEAQVISWMSFIASALHPVRTRGLERASAVWAFAEQRLGARQWAVGERYSNAHIHLVRVFWRFFNSLQPPREQFANLCAHHDRVLVRPAVQRTIEIESAIGYELRGFVAPEKVR